MSEKKSSKSEKKAEPSAGKDQAAAPAASVAAADAGLVGADGAPIAASTETAEPAAPGGPDAPKPRAVDISTTRAPRAVGLPDVNQAKRDLAENPARTSVLSKDGHVVREA